MQLFCIKYDLKRRDVVSIFHSTYPHLSQLNSATPHRPLPLPLPLRWVASLATKTRSSTRPHRHQPHLARRLRLHNSRVTLLSSQVPKYVRVVQFYCFLVVLSSFTIVSNYELD
ncbi:hypothetical protein CFOL_v3_30555, partial [Cephalotus follicularis]